MTKKSLQIQIRRTGASMLISLMYGISAQKILGMITITDLMLISSTVCMTELSPEQPARILLHFPLMTVILFSKTEDIQLLTD